MNFTRAILILALGAVIWPAAQSVAGNPPSSTLNPPSAALSWPPLTSQNKPWLWWWWPGSAVDPANIANQLQTFQDAGLGGVQVIPIYGIHGGEADYINFLSPQWMQMLNDTITDAHRLGMGADMALETGWCFGGPTISKDEANALVVKRTFDVAGGERFVHDFSRATPDDVAQVSKPAVSPISKSADRTTSYYRKATGPSIQQTSNPLALMAFNTNGTSLDLTRDVATDGHIQWIAPPGQW